MTDSSTGPNDRLVFDCGLATVDLDPSGRVLNVRHEDHPELSYLTRRPAARATTGEFDRPSASSAAPVWEVLETRRDIDEYEVVATSADAVPGVVLRRVLRHGFTTGWTTRIAWSHDAPRAVLIDGLGIDFAAGPGCLIWGLAAAEDTACAVLQLTTEQRPGADARTGAPPILGGRLRRGSGLALGPDGLTLRPILLGPGEQLVVQWEWTWYATPADYARNRHPGVPWALTGWEDDAITLDTGPDTVLLVDGRTVERQEDVPYVVERTYASEIELRSASGTTIFTLDFVPTLDQVTTVWVDGLLQRPRGPAGVCRLPGTAAAVLLQNGVLTGGGSDTPDADDALDAFTARRFDAWSGEDAGDGAGGIGAGGDPDPMLTRLFAAASRRTDDTGLFDAAEQVLLAQTMLRPGLGLALLDLTFAWWTRNQEPASWTDRRLRAHLAGLDDRRDRADRSCAAVAAAVEISLVLGRRPEPADLRTLGEWLGAGLIGGPAVPVDPLARAQAVAAVRLLPESEATALVPDWNCSAADLAQRAAPEVVRDLIGTQLTPGRVGRMAERIDEAARALVFLEFSRS